MEQIVPTVKENQQRSRKTTKQKRKTPSPEQPKRLIDTIDSPRDLRKIPLNKLRLVAREIRELMLDNVSQHGGHLAPSLGAVELAIALHYVYDTPKDKLVWDVGHQAYAHKILTGRRENFNTLRQYKGISGFPRISESEYDTVSTGHASTSISTSLGIAMARDIKKEKFDVVAVIGDGSLSGGLAFEGLNNLGTHSTKMTIILNDNKMSISKNVGALSRYLTRVITDRRFHKIKGQVWQLLGNMSHVGKSIRNLVHDIDDTLKHFVIPGKLFEDMGIRYFGPVDGHNIAEMIEVFKFARDTSKEPAIIHVITKKGKGYRFAEDDATKYHGISAFSKTTGTVNGKGKKGPTYSQVFGKSLVEFGAKRKDIVAITAAMPDGTGLKFFRDTYPDRFFDVGIAESHAVTFSAGLALNGLKPVVALYSTFLQRAYDQIMHDVALDKLPIVFCIDRAGLVGDDGPTHHGMFDLSFLRTVPRALIMTPKDERELKNMLLTALEYNDGPSFLRYPRGSGLGVPLDKNPAPLPIGRPEIEREGKKCAIIATGVTCAAAQEAITLLEKESISPALVSARFVKPLDKAFYTKLFDSYSHIITLENNILSGGFGSGILELATQSGKKGLPKFLCLGYPDEFVEHGDLKILLKNLKLDAEGIAKQIRAFVKG
ncbi:MAG: 1-deoxy-D-xylulose-5-phosphate synthase [Chitinivibrionales bacterium]|nr:1-deoxy-D-xylulose-5-phosphate synthase [Chitinivibrionales bacterium]